MSPNTLTRFFLLVVCSLESAFRSCVVNGAEWLGGNSQQVTGDSGLI